MPLRIKSSPCVGLCSTTYGDDICRGCLRTLDEVLHWRTKSVQEHAAYYQRLSEKSSYIINVYWHLNNIEKIKECLLQDRDKLYYPQEDCFCVYVSLFQLLQQNISPIARYPGLITWKCSEMPIAQLSQLIARFVYVSSESVS